MCGRLRTTTVEAGSQVLYQIPENILYGTKCLQIGKQILSTLSAYVRDSLMILYSITFMGSSGEIPRWATEEEICQIFATISSLKYNI